MLYRTPKVLGNSPQSPDLNPIEHLWEYVEKNLRELNISCKDDIKTALQDEETKIPPEFTRRLMESVPSRLEAVIKSKGRQIEY